MLKFTALLSYRLCPYIRWPLTRTRAAPAPQGCPLRLPPGAQRFLLHFVGTDDPVAVPKISARSGGFRLKF